MKMFTPRIFGPGELRSQSRGRLISNSHRKDLALEEVVVTGSRRRMNLLPRICRSIDVIGGDNFAIRAPVSTLMPGRSRSTSTTSAATVVRHKYARPAL
jgi:undecaprenyl pyrophosphate phosphatase UppP